MNIFIKFIVVIVIIEIALWVIRSLAEIYIATVVNLDRWRWNNWIQEMKKEEKERDE